jgi:predicted DNA-binding transcriptional regulator YafY
MVLLRASSVLMVDDDPGPTGRLLALLSLLQARPQWSGPALAERLGVTVRTVRRDVERLRRLGYPVLAAIGTTGGYRLGSGGAAMPPLMLDRDEALAVAVCLRSTATESIAGGGEAAIRALAKLEQLLPAVLRRQVGAISTMTARLGGGSSPVDPEVLVTLTRACRDGERLRARYRDQRGRETDRRLDPHRLVMTARRWYLVARDVDRDAWRTLRVDRLLGVEATGHRVVIEDPPDPVALVQSAISTTAYRHQARVELAAPLADVEARVPPTTGILEALDAERTMLTTGGDDLDLIVFHLLALDVDFVVHEPPALRAHIERVRHRLARAVR